MYQSSSRGGAGLPGAFAPLASIAALIGTILFGGELYPLVEPAMWARLTTQYSYDAAAMLMWCVWLASYPAFYFVLRAGVLAASLALMAFTTNRFM